MITDAAATLHTHTPIGDTHRDSTPPAREPATTQSPPRSLLQDAPALSLARACPLRAPASPFAHDCAGIRAGVCAGVCPDLCVDAAAAGADNGQMSAAGRKTILLVEDDALVALAERKQIERFGYSVVTADTARAAIETVGSNSAIDLILMDIDLGPGMDGTEAAQAILTMREIPIVFLSSHTEREVVERTEKITSYGYVVKNSGETVLRVSIQMAFRLFEAHRSIAVRSTELTSANKKLRSINKQLERSQSELRRNTQLLSGSERRADRQRNALAELMLDPSIVAGDIPAALKRITKLVSSTINVARTGIRTLSSDGSSLECDVLYNALLDTYDTGSVRTADEFPAYFAALHAERRIYAENALDDPRTTELSETHLIPLGVSAMIDAGIIVTGRLVGVVCCEHVGPRRWWHPDEQAFVETISALIGQLFLSSERRHAEELLRYSEQKYRTLFEASPVALWEEDFSHLKRRLDELTQSQYDLQSYLDENPNEVRNLVELIEIVDVNPAALDLYGVDHKADLIENLPRFLSERSYDSFREAIVSIASGHTSFTTEDHHLTAIGKQLDIEFKWTVAPGHKESFSRVLASVVDVTERKRHEALITAEKERFKRLFHGAPLATAVLDRQDRVVDCNSRFSELFGYTRDEVCGGCLNDLIVPEELRSEASRISREALNGLPVYLETTRTCKDGSRIEVAITGGPLDLNREQHVYAIYQNITDRKRAENALRKSEARLAESLNEKLLLLKETHHRLKNNMSTIASMLRLQAEEADDGRSAQVLREAAVRAQSMVVLYDKLYRSEQYHEISVASYLPQLVHEIVAVFGWGPPIKTTIDVEEFTLNAKQLAVIGIIMSELVTNSMKHAFPSARACGEAERPEPTTPSAGRASGPGQASAAGQASASPEAPEAPKITVSARCDGETVTITHRDNGVGLPDEVADGESVSFGMRLIELLVEQLHGSLSIHRDHGTRYVIEFGIDRT